jgi:histidine triad (HIT) family protein
MTTIFTKIINREVPGHFLYEDEVCVAILDKFPTVKGQAVVIPRKEVDYAFDLDEETFVHLTKIAKHIARALDKALGTKRTCMVIEGFHMPHVHIKLYPLMDTKKPLGTLIMELGEEASDEELALIATQIIGAFEEKDEDE